MDENDVEFQTFLRKLSEYYAGVNLRWLRMLLFDNIPIGPLGAKSALDLFNQLTERGLISKTDVKLLSDIAEVTMMALATKHINKYKNTIQSSDTAGVGLTAYRRAMFNVLTNTDEDDLMTVIGFYKLSAYNYNNIWDVVYHIEKAGRLNSQDDRDTFAKLINQHAQSFLKVEVATSNNEEQGMPKEVKSETGQVATSSNEEQGIRKGFKSETGQVATSNNEEQGMRKGVKSETGQVATNSNEKQTTRKEGKSETEEEVSTTLKEEQGKRKEYNDSASRNRKSWFVITLERLGLKKIRFKQD
ncbi:uncharacterized protein [Antedon mediterranea]|uniref:uncharacterized protein n=1 Tax=Antedon mediterranea TaxID=105859 RepID=UPI003AF612B5